MDEIKNQDKDEQILRIKCYESNRLRQNKNRNNKIEFKYTIRG